MAATLRFLVLLCICALPVILGHKIVKQVSYGRGVKLNPYAGGARIRPGGVRVGLSGPVGPRVVLPSRIRPMIMLRKRRKYGTRPVPRNRAVMRPRVFGGLLGNRRIGRRKGYRRYGSGIKNSMKMARNLVRNRAAILGLSRRRNLIMQQRRRNLMLNALNNRRKGRYMKGRIGLLGNNVARHRFNQLQNRRLQARRNVMRNGIGRTSAAILGGNRRMQSGRIFNSGLLGNRLPQQNIYKQKQQTVGRVGALGAARTRLGVGARSRLPGLINQRQRLNRNSIIRGGLLGNGRTSNTLVNNDDDLDDILDDDFDDGLFDDIEDLFDDNGIDIDQNDNRGGRVNIDDADDIFDDLDDDDILQLGVLNNGGVGVSNSNNNGVSGAVLGGSLRGDNLIGITNGGSTGVIGLGGQQQGVVGTGGIQMNIGRNKDEYYKKPDDNRLINSGISGGSVLNQKQYDKSNNGQGITSILGTVQGKKYDDDDKDDSDEIDDDDVGVGIFSIERDSHDYDDNKRVNGQGGVGILGTGGQRRLIGIGGDQGKADYYKGGSNAIGGSGGIPGSIGTVGIQGTGQNGVIQGNGDVIQVLNVNPNSQPLGPIRNNARGFQKHIGKGSRPNGLGPGALGLLGIDARTLGPGHNGGTVGLAGNGGFSTQPAPPPIPIPENSKTGNIQQGFLGGARPQSLPEPVPQPEVTPVSASRVTSGIQAQGIALPGRNRGGPVTKNELIGNTIQNDFDRLDDLEFGFDSFDDDLVNALIDNLPRNS